MEEFFEFHGTPEHQCLRIVSFHMEGRAAGWYQWMKSNNLLTTWREFLANLKYRFATTLYDDPQGELSKLTQTTTVAEFQSAFEELMNRVTGVSEQLLISFFITGLQQDIRRELLFNRPAILMATFVMARALEAKFNDTKPHTRSWSKWQPQSTFPSMPTTQTRTVPLPLLSQSHSSTISANPPSSKPPPPHSHNKTNTLPALLPIPNLPIC